MGCGRRGLPKTFLVRYDLGVGEQSTDRIGGSTTNITQEKESNVMGNLPKYTLTKDEKKDDWALKNDTTNRVKARFDTKEEATKGGVLAALLGNAGGSVKIQKENSRFQEERTYPGSKDPRSSKG